MAYIKTYYIFNHFYSLYLVLLTMGPRNTTKTVVRGTRFESGFVDEGPVLGVRIDFSANKTHQ